MSILPPFEGPRRKLRQADKHIKRLIELVSTFSREVELTVRQLSGPRNQNRFVEWGFQFSKEPPEDVPSLIGDAIHNMRAALDIIICDVARARQKSTAKLDFPFANSEQDLIEKLKKPQYKRLGNDFIETIRRIGPYKGGNIALRALHDLDIIDKHQLILPVYMVAWVSGDPTAAFMSPEASASMDASMRQMLGFDFSGFKSPLSEKSRFYLKEGTDPWTGVHLYKEGPVPSLAQGFPFAGESVIVVLEELFKLCTDAVEFFAAEFSGDKGNTTGGSTPDNEPAASR